MGTRDWGLGAGKRGKPVPTTPLPPLFQGGKGVAMLEGGQLKKIIKNFYHLFKNRCSPLFI